MEGISQTEAKGRMQTIDIEVRISHKECLIFWFDTICHFDFCCKTKIFE